MPCASAARSTVRLDVARDHLAIDIEDDGPGISDAHKASVLEPFVRGDQARNMDEAEGFGLGLSIANAIVLAHGGTLSLHDRKPHGLGGADRVAGTATADRSSRRNPRSG